VAGVGAGLAGLAGLRRGLAGAPTPPRAPSKPLAYKKKAQFGRGITRFPAADTSTMNSLVSTGAPPRLACLVQLAAKEYSDSAT
jgi:hypothetical protein